jgi:hypothetical protein
MSEYININNLAFLWHFCGIFAIFLCQNIIFGILQCHRNATEMPQKCHRNANPQREAGVREKKKKNAIKTLDLTFYRL